MRADVDVRLAGRARRARECRRLAALFGAERLRRLHAQTVHRGPCRGGDTDDNDDPGNAGHRTALGLQVEGPIPSRLTTFFDLTVSMAVKRPTFRVKP